MTYMNNFMQSQHQQNISGAMGQAGAMFQPGFANTTVQEVQQLNQGGYASAAPTYGMSFGGGIGGTQAMFQPGFANTNAQEVRQLNAGYAAPSQQGFQQTQAAYQPAFGASTQSIFSPGFAGTNVQEVQQRNNSGFGGYTGQAGFTNASFGGSIFSPGFAGTNVQEVQQRNNTGFGGYAGQAGLTNASLGGSIFSPGFAGTNVQEVQQRNNTGYAGYTGNTGLNAQMGGGIFSPGFAGTNVQEVRQQNQGGTAMAGIMSSGYGLQPQQQSYQNYGSTMGANAQSMFSPGFAGTNTQEVRAQNNLGGQMTAYTGSIFPGSF
ncbi:hypothetical protein [Brevibacillus choshinensis]|uniref:Uncharacterized protein n=1 Tax=Brevibacillus choshinensis TaxID=54911 RepID=A0ABX7FTN1_BRECH|nr:hypothetical protein [Brevibacillus choshinensis]QRG68934.1 hypothetical protein JNE38_07275 [Brevibacillus choshinensis]